MDALRIPGTPPRSLPASAAVPAAVPAAWDAAHARWRVQVFGATGARGRELVLALLQAGHPPARLELYARGAHALAWRGTSLPVRPVPPLSRGPRGLPPAELAFLCTPPGPACELSQRLVGTRVVDLSGGLRRDAAALYLPGVNDGALGAFTEQLALPLPSTALLTPALARVERAVGLAELDVFAVVAAAHGGAREVAALRAELAERSAGGQGAPGAPRAGGSGDVRATRIGNLRPMAELQRDFEAEMAGELKHLLARPDLLVDVTAVAGDAERCDFFAVKALLHAPFDFEAAAEVFGVDESLVLDPGEGPTPAAACGETRLRVGRIRPGSRGPRSLCFSAAGDQLRAGSVHAALRLAARLAA
jgi:aspartate-semialdehyde dehydrogenase